MPAETNTVTMNVSVPQRLKQYVDGKVSSGDYGSASEFVREAIREKRERDQERDRANAVLTAKLLEGLNSGKPIPFDENYIPEMKRRLKARAAKRRRS